MPPPSFETEPCVEFPNGLTVYKTLWDLVRGDGETLKLPPGRYVLWEAGRYRSTPDEHNHYSDGYYYEVRSRAHPNAPVLGYQWQEPLQVYRDLPRDDADDYDPLDDDENRPDLLIKGRQPAFSMGATVPLANPLEVWPGILAIQIGEIPDPLYADEVVVVDIGSDWSNEQFDEEDFYIYQVELPPNSRCWTDKSPYWTTEMSLLAARRVAGGASPERTAPRVESRKVCVDLGDVCDDVEAVASKRGQTVSQLLVQAWRVAREEMATLPSSPTPGLRQMREEHPRTGHEPEPEPQPGAGGQRSKGAMKDKEEVKR
jgi:hypothetical protein